MAPEPNLAGFADAQSRLRSAFGEQVTFLGEVTASFPDGTALDEESGQPYDPTVEPLSSGRASAVVRCTVVSQPVRGQDEPDASPFGWLERGHIALLAGIEHRAAIAGKTHAVVREREYLIISAKPDGIGGVQRLVVSCREEGKP